MRQREDPACRLAGAGALFVSMAARKGNIREARRQGYDAVLADVVRWIEAGRSAAARSVNAVMTATYWVGRSIVDEELRGWRVGYGEELVVNLPRDLQARFGRGFGRASTATRFKLAPCPPGRDNPTP